MPNNEYSKNMRHDITGLRAIAVASVVLYHYSKQILPGGFSGVDIFFVISGYLMTAIIITGSTENNFSYVKFIKSRANRILPALLTVVFFVLVLGYLFIAPSGYKEIAKHALASITFLSNFIYNSESGYFDTASDSKFLLHTWSLSAEWQFYLIYPMAVLLLKKLTTINKIKMIITISTILLFAFSLYLSNTDKASAYFLIQSRGWEMLFGGLAYLYPLNPKNNIIKKTSPKTIEATGLALIVVGLTCIDQTSLWPGYLSLLPVLGTYLCLMANNNTSYLDNVAFRAIGLWSYSIYLLHWPVLVFAKQLSIKLNLSFYLATILFLSVILHYTVEKRKNWDNKLVIALTIPLLFATVVWCTNGSSSRVPEDFRLTKDETYDKYYGGSSYKNANGNLIYLNEKLGKVAIILTGDSYSLQYLKYFSELKITTASVAHTMCLISQDYTSREMDSCNAMYGMLVKSIKDNKQADVIINQNWNAYQTTTIRKSDKYKISANEYNDVVLFGLNQILSNLSEQQKLFIVGTYSYPGYDVWQCLVRKALPAGRISKECPPYSENKETPIDIELKKFANLHKNVYFVDPHESLCNEYGCANYMGNVPVHFDGDHLSTLGAKLVGEKIYSLITNK